MHVNPTFTPNMTALTKSTYTFDSVFLRMYCKDLKPPDKETNNTEYLMDFNNYIDTKTPNNPMCKWNRTLFSNASALHDEPFSHFTVQHQQAYRWANKI